MSESNHKWCVGCSPDNCSGCGGEPVIDLEHVAYNRLVEAARKSKWIPKEYYANDWINDCINFLINGQAQPEPVESEPVAYYNPQEPGFYWAMPTKIDAPITVMVKPLPLYTTPQPDRTAELEAALKGARDVLEFYSNPHTAGQPAMAEKAIAKIEGVLK